LPSSLSLRLRRSVNNEMLRRRGSPPSCAVVLAALSADARPDLAVIWPMRWASVGAACGRRARLRAKPPVDAVEATT